ncbi:hypothetical protein G3I60_38680 [Streptomyces sp. SID13666]|uniref:DUF4429 domain-containing protein n=1 Tax=Streptomyces TaxID=1883 RepID=UPI0011068B58|nr:MULTISPECIES: SHOCT domain-containing protein [Streptomyces]MCZ4099264.1 SHOCT domain-containing protein [Streptomyces sp. H39-C1]NEA59926.1 hypothetical protein [Streptomyces sp. SID13666]NEA76100.1 hypothetical protein [Streptomyces sp. SID13588]QNA71543.1 hypothetical protein C8250_006165 [Streptomyces sp. So13.3]
MDASSRNVHVDFDGEQVTIQRPGLLSKRVERLPVARIGAVRWKAAGWTGYGSIRFILLGGNTGGTGSGPAPRTDSSVSFGKEQQADFEVLCRAVEAAIGKQSRAPRTPAAPPPVSLADELERLAGLMKRGLLTRPEFERAKRKLLR